MKRWVSVLAILSLVLGLSSVALAGDQFFTETTNLEPTATTIYVGEFVDLTATTLKHGSGVTDTWTAVDGDGITADGLVTGTRALEPVVNGLGEQVGDVYVSTARFTPTAAGTYSIAYTITMTSQSKNGNSNTWTGTAVSTITVLERAPYVTGVWIHIKDQVGSPSDDGKDPNGKGALYFKGDIYLEYSNDTQELYKADQEINFSQNQESRNFDVAVTLDGVTIGLAQVRIEPTADTWYYADMVPASDVSE